jgi:hypothetical protein
MITEIYGQHYDCDISREHIATIIRLEAPTAAGPEFFTDPGRPLQVGRMWYRKGHRVPAHRHLSRRREGFYGPTQEVIIVRTGRLHCYFFDAQGKFATNWLARPGDVIVIHGGGHAFEALEDVDLVEVKSGPYDPGEKESLEFLQDFNMATAMEEVSGGVTQQEAPLAMVAQQEDQGRPEAAG